MSEGRSTGDRDVREGEDGSTLAPYLIVLAVGIVIGAVVLAYVALHRDEILAILTQSPA
jgi:hypothetical protein